MMKQAATVHSSYAALFDPAVAREVAARAAQWNLPRREIHPLDRYPGRRIASELARYDAEVELAPVPEEEIAQAPQPAEAACELGFDDEEDF